MRRESRPRTEVSGYCLCGGNFRLTGLMPTRSEVARLKGAWWRDHVGTGHGEISRWEWRRLRGEAAIDELMEPEAREAVRQGGLEW